MRLTQGERYAIFRGEHRALRRPNKPKVKAGDKRVLSWTRGGRQVVDRESGATVEIPRKPNVWVEFMEPELRNGEWLIRFTIHDEREPLRLLAATPGPRSEAGLKTRWRQPGQVPDQSEYRERWTQESERGYGGSGRRAVDTLQAVDDEALAEFATVARMNFAERKEVERSEQVLSQQGKQLMRKLRRIQAEAARYGVDMSPQIVEIIRQMEDAIAKKRAA